MKRITLSFALAAAVVFAVAPAHAELDTYELDASHTSIVFKISHMGFSHTYGMFPGVEGTLTFDAEHLDEASIEATVQAASVNTMNEARDGHLKNEDFFNVEKFPVISFKSSKWEAGEDGLYKVTGDLSLLGKSKEITIDVKHVASGEGMKGELRQGFETEFTIKRSDFGMDYGVGGPLGDEVTLVVSLEATFQTPELPERL
ncbi:MAG: polyisoprenoid-binding protein [Candidatus Hydrogenedens sp.]|nr:polyisoprenoid-binding protein [Candidatus Hydrogenedens sp.]